MRILVTLLFVICLQSSVSAVGALYARRALSNDAGTPLWLKSYDADVTIIDQIAVTHIDHVFSNESSARLEGIFIFPLPEGAVVTELALWINGQRVVGDVMEKDTARRVYETVVRRAIDPALLEYMGDNVFKVSVFPIEPAGKAMSERRIELTYAQLLPFSDGQVNYSFFMKTASLSAKPVERASITGALSSQKMITSLSSPTHPEGTVLPAMPDDEGTYVFTYGNENTHAEKDLVVTYQFAEDDFAMNHLIYTPDAENPMFFDTSGDDGYFLLWVTPPHNSDSAQRLPKNVAFIADVSSSMEGKRIVQLREALHAMIGLLDENDRFSITAFSTGVQSFSDGMLLATPENKDGADAFVSELSEAGLTNYEDAFKTAFTNEWKESDVNVIVFLTDGEPTWPVAASKAKIINTVKDLNSNGVSLFTFGLGDEPDATFLRSLAVQNGGEYQAISDDAMVSSTLTGFMRRISYPLLKKCSLSMSTIDKYDVYPRVLPDLFAGSQLSVLGRFRTYGNSTVVFTGKKSAEEVVLTADLPFTAAQTDHLFVPRMWASAKIDYLLGEIALAGEQTELVDNVKKLGKKYAIITPYTSMLVLEPGTGTMEDKRVASAKHFSFTRSVTTRQSVTTMKYSLPVRNAPARVLLRIFDAKGRLVHTLVNELCRGGNYMVQWDGSLKNGGRSAAGRYFAVLEFAGHRGIVPIDVY